MSAPLKHASETGLRAKNGKWEYRFKLSGKPHSHITDLSAEPENILKAQSLRTAHIEKLKSGKQVSFKRPSMSLTEAVSQFNRWYKSEHPRGGDCKWAASLMNSFRFYFEQVGTPLAKINPSSLEQFKMWRRENNIHDNSLRKQLLLIGQFFRYCRKSGWIQGDPLAAGSDSEVVIPAEQDSDAMHVLSPSEETVYLASAKLETMDLHDVAVIMLEQGPRPDEILSLRQSHVDIAGRSFSIWNSGAEGKTKNAHRKLRMTDASYEIFSARLSIPGTWVFPSSKLDGPRTTLQKAHERATREEKGGCGVKCRIYDMRHTFATRFALEGGSLPLLSKILGHADLSLLMRYVHPAQADMDRAMEWFNQSRKPSLKVQEMLIEATNE